VLTPALVATLLAAAPVKVATGTFTYSGVDPQLGGVYLEQLAVRLTAEGLVVITQKDIAEAVGHERMLQLTGCAEDATDCQTELTGALGVDTLLVGNFAKTPESTTVILKFLSASSGQTLAAATTRVKTEAELDAWMTREARPLTRKVIDAVEELRARRAGQTPLSLSWRFVPGAAGVVAAIAGGLLYKQSLDDRTSLGALSREDPGVPALVSQGTLHQNLGVGLLIGGGALVGVSAVWLALGGGDGHVSLLLTPGAASVAVQGRWP
jgi:hypothetical protein